MILYTFKKGILFSVFFMAAFLSASIFAYGQDISVAWKPMQGNAADIAMGTDGSVLAVNAKGDVFEYNHSDENWEPRGRGMAKLAIASNGEFWGVSRTGQFSRFSNPSWIPLGNGAQDIAVAADENIYVTTNNNTLAVYNPKMQKWSAVAGSASKIAVDAGAIIWGISKDGTLIRILDGATIGMNVKANDIATDQAGRIFIAGQDGKLYQWNADKTDFTAIEGIQNVKIVAAGEGQIWVALDNGKIYAQGITAKQRADVGITLSEGGGGGGADPAEAIDSSAIIFERVPDNTKLTELKIGRDGSIYGLTSSGAIRRWSNTEQRFYEFPGTVNGLAVQDNGLPLAIGTNQNLIKHDGQAWRQVNLNLRLADVSVYGENDRALVINTEEQAAKLSESFLTYTLLPKQGEKIAAAPNGEYWVIDDFNFLFLCSDGGECARQSMNATDIDVGPGGSVFVVDTNAKLRRYNKSTKVFDLIATQANVAQIAVGPKDRPWITDTNGLVYQSGYFERDETFDRRLAIKTTATASVTSEEPNVDGNNGGVEIVRSISFTQVNIPTSASGYPNLGTGIRDITSGANDILIATGFKAPCEDGSGLNWLYNPNSKTFFHLDYLKRINLFTVIAVDDLVRGDVNGDTPPATPAPAIPSMIGEWNKNCANQSNIITYVSSVFSDPSAQSSQNFNGAVFGSPQPLNVIPDIDFAADGTVANIFGDDLEIFQPEVANDVDFFDEIDFMRVGIGTDRNDIWAVDTSNNVYEYVQSTDSFELRSPNVADKAIDVGVGQNGSVFIVSTAGILKKWDDASKRFIKTNKSNVTRVAVDSRGNPIVANFPDSQTVYFGR